jgi:hypothetical protein
MSDVAVELAIIIGGSPLHETLMHAIKPQNTIRFMTLLTSDSYSDDAEFFETAIEGATRNAAHFCCLDTIPIAGRKGLEDSFALALAIIFFAFVNAMIASGLWRRARVGQREIVDTELAAFAHEPCVQKDVFELTNVSGP